MFFVLKKGKTIPKIFFLTFLYSWTLLIGCVTQEGTMITEQHPHSPKNSIKFSEKQYQIYDATGKKTSLNKIIDQIGLVHVVFLGEMHNDPVAHYLQEVILRKITNRYWTNAYTSKRRQIVLSMEMFERDVQMILDEYLLNIIDETYFLSCARPWRNYYHDYHPLLKYAKKKSLRVLAANAPRRYVHRVAKQGNEALNDLSAIARTWIAPLPIRPPSEKMKQNLRTIHKQGGLMISPHENISEKSYLLDAQNLWDATMAYSINEELSSTHDALILHLNGFFHTLSGSGIPEHLRHYRPDVRMMVINIVRNDSFPKFNPQLKNSGDYVIITDPNIGK